MNYSTAETKITVVIIEDDTTIREGLTYLINNESGYYVSGSYSNAEEALKQLKGELANVILLDINLPGMSGIQAIVKLKMIMPKAHILMLTVYEDEENIFKSLTLGASGYLTKNISAHKIIEAIQEVVDGGAPMSTNVAKLVIKSFHKNTQNSPLTKRETEILEQVANGKSRTKIAVDLQIDVETVKTHIKNIYEKLDVHSRDEAIKTAKDNKFI
jgi:DNA-binding NarL/FixJ family response regulator